MSHDLKQLLELVAGRPLLTRKDLARRYGGVDLDTVDRWHRKGFLPKAVYLPGCRYPFWRPCDIAAQENRSQKLRKFLTI